MDSCKPVISTQVIKEFANILLRKTTLSLQNIQNIIHETIGVTDIANEETGLVFVTVDIHKQYKNSFYDSLIFIEEE